MWLVRQRESEKICMSKQLVVNNNDSVSYDKNVGIEFVERLLQETDTKWKQKIRA